MQNEITKNEKLTMKALKVSINNVFEEMKDNLSGKRNEVRKQKNLIDRFSIELIRNVVLNYEELDGVAKALKEISVSIDTFADALKVGKGQEVLEYLLNTKTDSVEVKSLLSESKVKKIADNEIKKDSVIEKVDISEIKKMQTQTKKQSIAKSVDSKKQKTNEKVELIEKN